MRWRGWGRKRIITQKAKLAAIPALVKKAKSSGDGSSFLAHEKHGSVKSLN